jgi:hypothetical protein
MHEKRKFARFKTFPKLGLFVLNAVHDRLGRVIVGILYFGNVELLSRY